MNYLIQVKKYITVNTDPQRRCYYGVNAREQTYLSDWENLSVCLTDGLARDFVQAARRCNISRMYRIVIVPDNYYAHWVEIDGKLTRQIPIQEVPDSEILMIT